jgi:hypothetical protein
MGEWRCNFGTRRRLLISFTTQPLYPRRKSTRCPLGRRLGRENYKLEYGCTEGQNAYLPIKDCSINVKIIQVNHVTLWYN